MQICFLSESKLKGTGLIVYLRYISLHTYGCTFMDFFAGSPRLSLLLLDLQSYTIVMDPSLPLYFIQEERIRTQDHKTESVCYNNGDTCITYIMYASILYIPPTTISNIVIIIIKILNQQIHILYSGFLSSFFVEKFKIKNK